MYKGKSCGRNKGGRNRMFDKVRITVCKTMLNVCACDVCVCECVYVYGYVDVYVC